MDLRAMLDKCRREQWDISDLDWTVRPRPMNASEEMAIVQYFTDMAGIERLAATSFTEQERKVDDPVLKEIFRSFVRDEQRHARLAERLARHYDVHRYKIYAMNPSLVRFGAHFAEAIRCVSAEVANLYLTGGELILDIALLRSLDEYVADEMSHRAMRLVNRDESRHIAIDFHMVEYHGSTEMARRRAPVPPRPIGQRVRAAWAVANVLYQAAPFFKGVFFEPMAIVDPSGVRLKEAVRWIQLLAARPAVRRDPLARLLIGLYDAYNDRPVVRWGLGRAIERLVGAPSSVLSRLVTEADRRRAARMSLDDLARDALAAKPPV